MLNYAGAAFGYLAAKFIVDKPEVPAPLYKKMMPITQEVESWANCFMEFESDDPYSWYITGRRLMGKLVKIPTATDSIARYLMGTELAGIGGVYNEYKPVVESLLDGSISPVKAAETDNYELHEFTFEDANLCFIYDKQKKKYKKEIWAPLDLDLRVKAYKGMSDAYWKNKRYVEIENESSSLSFMLREIHPVGNKFIGKHKKYLDQWRAFFARDVRRCVLLQGEPGTGKSTLIEQAAMNIGKRTLSVGLNMISSLNPYSWGTMLDILQPDVIIIDDLDRVRKTDLNSKLFLLDEKYEVPLTLITTNHYDELPDAMKRPGRIDQMIQMGQPEKEIRIEMIKHFAEREGVELEEGEYDRFDDILTNHTPAYLVEVLRRVSVLGKDYEIPEEDITFKIADNTKAEKISSSKSYIISEDAERALRKGGVAGFTDAHIARDIDDYSVDS